MQKTEENLLPTMPDASLHGVMILKPVYKAGVIEDFYIAGINPAFEAQVGFGIEEGTQALLSSVFPCYKKYGFFDIYLTTLYTNTVQARQLFYEDDKLRGWFDLNTAALDNAVTVTFLNITPSKSYHQNMERTAAQLQAIMDIAQTGIFIFSPKRNTANEVEDFYFTMANKTLAAYVGQYPQTLLGGLGSTWFPGYKTNGLFNRYKDTYETGSTNRFDFHYDDDGIDVWLDIMSTRLGNEVLVTFTDFTPVKQLQLRLQESVQNLKKSNQNLEEFAYAASHDLQEPLRKIHFFSDRLQAKFCNVLGAEGSEILQRMEASAIRMRTLIDDLLEYSKVSAQLPIFEIVDANTVVKEVLVDMETILQEKKAIVTIGNLPYLLGDAVQLRQLFHNLLSNSLKYTHPDRLPQISVNTAIVKGKHSNMQVAAADQNKLFHCIQIKDNGLGFEQEHAERIFQIFQRLHGRSEYPGTGVGLAIVQKVVENHRAYIVAEGKPNEGATFNILFHIQE